MASFKQLRRAALASVASVVIAGCSTNSTPNSQNSGVASPTSTTTTATPATAATPATTVGLSLCTEFGNETCPLQAGRYEVATFTPPLSLQLGSGWLNTGVFPDAITFVREESPDEEFLELALDVTKVFNADGTRATIAGTPGALITWLNGRKDFKVSKVSSSKLGSLPASTIDVVTTTNTNLFSYPTMQASYHVVPGQRIRFVIAMIGNHRIHLAAEAPDSRFDEFWDSLTPTLTSVAFK